MKRAEKVQRASDGCSRWYHGRKFPLWKYDPSSGIKDPGLNGYIAERRLKDGWTSIDYTGKNKASK
eukprot:13773560-Heterocapsa_arctica.AAC.1